MANVSRFINFNGFMLIVSCYFSSSVYGATSNFLNVIPMDALRLPSTCSSPSTAHKGVKVVPRYGPCSPLGLPKNSKLNSRRILLKDKSRVDFINNPKSSKLKSTDASLALSDSILGAGNYLVTVGFGTPKQDSTLILDTGSDITWTQCKPCSVRCYPQTEPIFDPSASSSYSSAACSSSCNYSVTYADRSFSKGHYANDTLTLPGSGTFPGFIFGCGQDNSDGFGSSAGMLGLSQGSSLSLVSQTYSEFAKILCYCLTTRDSSTGYLLFGEQALVTCQTKTYTPLLANPKNRPLFYFVNLVGVTIGSKRLVVSSFLSGSKTPNTIIDSGTVITRLPSAVYSGLSAEFKRLMSGYPAAAPLPPLLDTCYNLTGYASVAIPKVVMHFYKVDVELDPSGVVWRGSDSQVCLGFAGNSNAGDLIIVGNNQQKTVGILYDIQENKVEFSTNAC